MINDLTNSSERRGLDFWAAELRVSARRSLEFNTLGLKIRWEQSSIGEGLAEKAFEAQNLTAINRARPL